MNQDRALRLNLDTGDVQIMHARSIYPMQIDKPHWRSRLSNRRLSRSSEADYQFATCFHEHANKIQTSR